MGAYALRPETRAERLIYWSILSTWGLWLLGALYPFGPLLGTVLLVVALYDGFHRDADPEAVPHVPPLSVWVWVVGMAVMAVALIIGHIDFDHDLLQTMKSLIGWAKGWALMAIFILAGAMLRVRPQVIYRATSVLAVQTLALAPLFLIAGVIELPALLYVSPLSVLGGPSSDFYDVSLYATDETTGKLRWRFFAPWATAAACAAGIGMVFAIYERSRMWQAIGLACALAVCLMSGSRLSLVAIPVTLVGVALASNMLRPGVYAMLGVVATVAILAGNDIAAAYSDLTESFNNARAVSSRVRAGLQSIALHRWITEAPIFGHGIVERGPYIVHYMPIGSHHTWVGLLFTKGIVGLTALAVPMLWSGIVLTIKAQTDRVARVALGVLIIVFLASFGDNIEMLAYIIWPGLIIIGIALRRPIALPFRQRLGA